jgi:hypothetical protein
MIRYLGKKISFFIDLCDLKSKLKLIFKIVIALLKMSTKVLNVKFVFIYYLPLWWKIIDLLKYS